jgi:hypothetical protein
MIGKGMKKLFAEIPLPNIPLPFLSPTHRKCSLRFRLSQGCGATSRRGGRETDKRKGFWPQMMFCSHHPARMTLF